MANRRLLLISASLGALSDFVREEPTKLRLAFVPTAGDPYAEPTFVNSDRQKLQSMGFTICEFDIKNKTTNELQQTLSKIDILYIAGGNSFYLLEKMRTSGLDHVLPAYLDAGLLYVGASAGAIVAGPDIEPISELDDSSQATELQSTQGLALVPFVALPHYGKEKYANKYNKILNTFGGRYKLIPFTDEQAIVVENDNYKIVDSAES